MSASSSEREIYAHVLEYLQYTYILVLVAGVIGNVLIVLTLTRLRLFRRNQCALYFNVESVVNTVALVYLFVDYRTQYDDGSDLADYSLPWCKIRSVVDQMTQLLPFAIICFAAFDQLLCTSHWYTLRQMSTFRLAQVLLCLTACVAGAHSLPSVYLLRIISPIGCMTDNRTAISYYLFFYYPVLVGGLPIIISSLFSMIAFRNVRRLVRLQVPLVRRKLDRQLTAMVFTRVIAFVLLYSPYVIYRTYTLVKLSSGDYDIPFMLDLLMQKGVILLKDIDYMVRPFAFEFTREDSIDLGELLSLLALLGSISSAGEVVCEETALHSSQSRSSQFARS